MLRIYHILYWKYFSENLPSKSEKNLNAKVVYLFYKKEGKKLKPFINYLISIEVNSMEVFLLNTSSPILQHVNSILLIILFDTLYRHVI